MQGGWQNLMAAPMGGGTLDAPGEFLEAGGGGLGLEGEDGGEAGESGSAVVGNEAAVPSLPPLPSGTGLAGYLCAEASLSMTSEEGPGVPMPPLVVLLRSCSEGDNTPEAVEMAQAVNASLEILPRGGGEGEVRWSSPLSWASLYGLPPSSDAYQ
ncbi:unnamed protein product [Pylaiella littoralis]